MLVLFQTQFYVNIRVSTVVLYFLLQLQYSFVYDAVLDALMSGETTIPNSSFQESYEDMCTPKLDAKNTLLYTQFEVCWHVCVNAMS